VSVASLFDLAAAGKLPHRVARAMVADGFHTIADLAGLSRHRLRCVPQVGPLGRQIIRDLLAANGYDVAPVPPNSGGASLSRARRSASGGF